MQITTARYAKEWQLMRNTFPEFRAFARSATDLERAFHRRLRSIVENKRHPVSGRNGD